MSKKYKYLNLILFSRKHIYIASSLMKSEPLEKHDDYALFYSDKWKYIDSINRLDLGPINFDETGGHFYLDNHQNFILFSSPTIKIGKNCMLKLLRHYEKDVV